MTPISRAAALLAVILCLAPPALRGDEPPEDVTTTGSEADPREAAAASEQLAAPAEPLPRAGDRGDEAPALGGTVVAPVRPQRFEVGRFGAIEVGPRRAATGRWRGAPISISLRDAPLPEVLRAFARLAGVNLVLDPRVKGSVTVELVDVPWDQALHVILKTHGMAAEIDGRVWLVEPR